MAVYDEDGNLYCREIPTYDEDGRTMEISCYVGGLLFYTYICRCNENGNLTEMTVYADDSSVQTKYCQQFGAGDRLIMRSREFGDPESGYVERYRYRNRPQARTWTTGR